MNFAQSISVHLQTCKRFNSARFLPGLKLTTSNMRQVSYASWTVDLDNVEIEASLQNFPKCRSWSKKKQFCETSVKNGKLSAELMASHQRVLWLFHSMRVTRCACHEKMIDGSLEAKLPTIWTDGQAQPLKKKLRQGESQKREDHTGRKSEERRCRRAKR